MFQYSDSFAFSFSSFRERSLDERYATRLLAEQATPKLRRDVIVRNYMTKTTTINVNKVSLQIELEGATQ